MTRSLSLFFISSSWLLFLTLFVFCEEEPNAALLLGAAVATIVNSALFLWFLRTRNVSFYSFSFIFVLGYLIVHLQVLTLEFFGFRMPNFTYDLFWASELIKNKTVLISAVGIVSYYFGYLLTSSGRITLSQTSAATGNDISNAFFLVFIAGLFYLLFFATSGEYRSGVYSGDGALGASAYFYKIFNIALMAAIIVRLSYISSLGDNAARNLFGYFHLVGWPLLSLTLWHICFSLYVGNREPVISYSLLLFSLYYIRLNKLSVVKTAAYVLVFSTVLTVIGEVRQARHSGSDLASRYASASQSDKSKWYDEKIVGNSTIELALSMRTLNHTLINVPSRYDYQLGLFQLQKLIATVPGGAGLFNKLVYNGDKRYDGTSNFITYLIQGDRPLYGDGTSITADLYIDFGIVGIVGGLLLLGCFMGKNEWRLAYGAQRANSFAWLVIVVFLSKSLFLSRSAILFEISRIILIFAFIHLNLWLVRAFKK